MSVRIITGDCLEALPTLAEASIDACVTDPPYHLTSIVKRFGKSDPSRENYINAAPKSGYMAGYMPRAGFMGKEWDGGDVAFRSEMWAQVLRVLKPGGHLLAFGGSRTYHRLACAIEDAGFEIRDQIMWIYGCLDDQTQVATAEGVKPHHKTRVGDLILCYDVSTGGYSYQPILEIVEYEFNDTAYRLIGDFGEQVVTKNHRCIVERFGMETFQFAEEAARQREACVPILESLPELQQALSDTDKGTGGPRQDMQREMCGGLDRGCEHWKVDDERADRSDAGSVRSLRQDVLAQYEASETRQPPGVLKEMQWRDPRCGMETARPQGQKELEPAGGSVLNCPNDWSCQSGMEGRSDLSEPEGQICGSVNQIYSVSAGFHSDGSERWLRYGTSDSRGLSHEAPVDASGDGASSKSRRDQECEQEFDVIRDKYRSQGIRAWRGHRSAMVRIVSFHHVGKVWCLRVPTGAFVAVRGGVAFPTGNSGFPKSLDVSKAIDEHEFRRWLDAHPIERAQYDEQMRQATDSKARDHVRRKFRTAAGAEREVVGRRPDWVVSDKWRESEGRTDRPDSILDITSAATAAAKQWDGWGTALKPAHEPIVLARKPLIGTVASNVLAHGTGALNIDGCRVGDGKDRTSGGLDGKKSDATLAMGGSWSGERFDRPTGARWPANVIHDGSEEVVVAFPESSTTGKRLDPEKKYNSVGLGINPHTNDDHNGAEYTDSGSAARFFYQVKQDEPCHSTKHANDADNSFALQSEHVVSALSSVVDQSTARLMLQKPSYRALNMSVSEQQLGLIVGSVTEAIQNIERRFSLGLPRENITVQLGHAICVATQKPIGITTITIDLLMSGRFAEVVTFDTIETILEVGVLGSACRAFYSAKADKGDRLSSKHPTVKPIDLMAYLCRLVTPPGGTVLDPFAGSGSTGMACMREGFDAILIEREAEYVADIKRRIAHVSGEDTPLFVAAE